MRSRDDECFLKALVDALGYTSWDRFSESTKQCWELILPFKAFCLKSPQDLITSLVSAFGSPPVWTISMKRKDDIHTKLVKTYSELLVGCAVEEIAAATEQEWFPPEPPKFYKLKASNRKIKIISKTDTDVEIQYVGEKFTIKISKEDFDRDVKEI